MTVVPPSPIINRRTGAATHFGARRAYDGFYLLELLRATGVTNEEAATVARVLEPLLENCGRFTIERLLESLPLYYSHNDMPAEGPKPKPHLTIVE